MYTPWDGPKPNLGIGHLFRDVRLKLGQGEIRKNLRIFSKITKDISAAGAKTFGQEQNFKSKTARGQSGRTS